MNALEEAELIARIRQRDIKYLSVGLSVFLVWAAWVSNAATTANSTTENVKQEQERRGKVIDTIPEIRKDVEVLKTEQRHTHDAIEKLDNKVEGLDSYLRNKLGE